MPRAKVSRYGVIAGNKNLYLIEDFIEKPGVQEAPSNLAIAGRYVFTPEIFEYLENLAAGKNNEIQLTDAMRKMVRERAMYGLRFEGTRYDIGNKLDFLKTNVIFGLKSKDLGREFRAFLKEVV